MSSQGHKISNRPNKKRTDEVELTERFSEQMAQLCLCDDYSDVVFVVEGKRLPAHRVILAARSEYFRALLYGGLSESHQREITLKIPVEAFKALLKYIYSGRMPLSEMSDYTIFDTLGLAHEYGFLDLELAISDYMEEYLSLSNACGILDVARLYDLKNLVEVCLTFMDRHALEILTHDSFLSLSKESVEEVLKRDSFFVAEALIFVAVKNWCQYNPNIDAASVISYVRLPLIGMDDLLHIVRNSGIFDPDRLLDAIEEQTSSTSLPYRGILCPEMNVTTPKFGAQAISGECRTALLDGDTTSYDMEVGYARHNITDGNDTGITVELCDRYLINHIKILLWDRDGRAYSYYIEVSVDQKSWERVVDYSNYPCRSWQYLYFPSRSVQFIKVVGTHNTINKAFHVVSLEAKHTAEIPNLVNGFVAPTENIATTHMSAIVVEGVSRSRNALLNGDCLNYDWDFGYTCHQLGSGEILVRLGQPYYIGSVRLLLWDCDDRTYNYYIETSIDRKEWDIAVDKRNEPSKSWQNYSFPPRPVVYIRIVGTKNTANEIFHCVHFECPSQDPNSMRSEKKKSEESEKTIKAKDDKLVELGIKEMAADEEDTNHRYNTPEGQL